ncbi:MAG: DUF1207 domain-containing protein [Elusimicrobia bacterium]|nr:DUF1207 domain-containing protein [Elusimicrobiota bacterium]
MRKDRGASAWRVCGAAILLFQAAAAAAASVERLLPDAPFPSARDYFEPVVADPAELGYGGRMVYPPGGPRLGEVMIGDYVGISRWRFGDWGAQLNLGGGAIGRFNLSTERNNLEAVDFTLKVPVDVFWRSGQVIRTEFWHTSSHLGDDYIGRVRPTLRKRAFDALRMIYSWTPSPWLRAYGGGSFAFNTVNLDGRGALQAGAEVFGPLFWGERAQLFLAQDLQTFERTRWNPAYNIRGGLRLSDETRIAAASLFMEYFTGRAYYLQFQEHHESHWGFGLRFEIGNPPP